VIKLARLAYATLVVAAATAGTADVWSKPTQPAHVRRAPAMSSMAMATAPRSPGMPHGVSQPELGPELPPGSRRGLAYRLPEYPAIFLATKQQRAAATHLWGTLRATALRWARPAAAAAAGFDVRRPHRAPGDRRPMWFHSENRRWHADRSYLDARRPDTLIFADLPGRPLRLVGVMFSMPRGMHGPTPGGPITRWHYHLVCVTGDRRGLAPRSDGSCPTGAVLGQGSEMMHVWFTRDLRSAFAVEAPLPELCAARMLPADTCSGRRAFSGM